MRIGFLTGSLSQIGSGRTEALPLALALLDKGCSTYGIETSRFFRRKIDVDGLPVHFEPTIPFIAVHAPQVLRSIVRRQRVSPAYPLEGSQLDSIDQAAASALQNLILRLNLDVVYAFHNTNIARIAGEWPHPERILVINPIGFGIDPSRGGATDTFGIQAFIFKRPYWDLHIAATYFEFEQYRQVYEMLDLHRPRLLHLPHSYDQARFCPDLVLHGSGSDEKSRKLLLYPVNVYRRKNIELALDVVAHLVPRVDLELFVSGRIWDTEYHTHLLQKAEQLNIADRVRFLEGVPQQHLIELYRRADAVLFTSHQETFGHGIVEALGCGTPVVGPNWIIPCREILISSMGGWAAQKTPDALADAVWEALRHPPDRMEIAEAARSQYGNVAVAQRFLDTVQEIKEEKQMYRRVLYSIDWKALYCDEGNLL